MRLRHLAILAVLTLHAGYAAAYAIYSPAIEESEKALEWRSTFHPDAAEEHKLELEYSPTDWWRAALLATVERSPGGQRQISELAFENVFRLNPQGRDWIDWGLLTELSRTLRPEHAWAAEVGLLAEHATPKTVTQVNVALERDLQPGAEANMTVAVRWRWRAGRRLEPGLEYYAELGSPEHLGSLRSQQHSLGPALVGRVPQGRNAIRYEAAWVFGLSSAAPSSTARVQLEWEFR